MPESVVPIAMRCTEPAEVCLQMFPTGSGFLQFQSDYEFISGLTEVFWESYAMLLLIQFVKFMLWKLTGTWAFRQEGMQRLVEYISRCPFSLTRMISTTKEGDILYRASNPQCIAFPIAGDQELTAGNPRNFEVFKSLDFLANVTQHIPDKGEHQIRYYGFYSNKKRGMRGKKDLPKDESHPGIPEGDTGFVKKCKMTPVLSLVEAWAALIKCVYEACTERCRSVDPLKCPKPVVSRVEPCGGTMKIISFIEGHQADVIEKILRHCGLWKEEPPRPPPPEAVLKLDEPKLDYGLLSLSFPM